MMDILAKVFALWFLFLTVGTVIDEWRHRERP
jgi:hypothetical protein